MALGTRFNHVQFNPIRFNPIRFNPIRFNYIRYCQLLEQKPMLRWGSSFIAVVGAQLLIILLIVTSSTSIPKSITAQPMAAFMVDLAPIPTAQVSLNSITPEPIQKETPPLKPMESEPVVKQLDIEPLPELPDIKDALALIPEKTVSIEEPITQKEKADDELEEFTVIEESAPPAADVPSVAETAAPKQGAVSLVQSDAINLWQSTLSEHLERHKRYPRKARRMRQEAVILVRFTMNREGYVMEYHLENPSVHSILNKAVLQLIKQAQPLPPPPPEVEGDPLEFMVPVVYSLRR